MNDHVITCPICGSTGTQNEFDACLNGSGVWCLECESFIWNNPKDNHQHITLLLEQKSSSASAKEDKVIIPYKFNKRLSPLRYPGGKSKLIDYLFTRLQTNKCETFVEVFAGGSSFGLALLDAGIIKHLVINDKDKNLIAFWNETIHNPNSLIDNLLTIHPTYADYIQAKAILRSNASVNPSELAWAYLLANRLSYSGIQKAGCMGGLNGTNNALLVRYNPKRLIEQIKRITALKDKITVLNQDYLECIENFYWDNKTTLFIDPPYYEKGKLLYNHYFTEKDHRTLSELLTSLTLEFPGAADVLITYDNNSFIKELYWSLEPIYVNRLFSINKKKTV